MIRVFTGSGGGYGDPRERNPELVRADVRNGLLSPRRARDVYGVDTEGVVMANDGPLKLMYLSPVGTPDFDGNHISECPRAPGA